MAPSASPVSLSPSTMPTAAPTANAVTKPITSSPTRSTSTGGQQAPGGKGKAGEQKPEEGRVETEEEKKMREETGMDEKKTEEEVKTEETKTNEERPPAPKTETEEEKGAHPGHKEGEETTENGAHLGPKEGDASSGGEQPPPAKTSTGEEVTAPSGVKPDEMKTEGQKPPPKAETNDKNAPPLSETSAGKPEAPKPPYNTAAAADSAGLKVDLGDDDVTFVDPVDGSSLVLDVDTEKLLKTQPSLLVAQTPDFLTTDVIMLEPQIEGGTSKGPLKWSWDLLSGPDGATFVGIFGQNAGVGKQRILGLHKRRLVPGTYVMQVTLSYTDADGAVVTLVAKASFMPRMPSLVAKIKGSDRQHPVGANAEILILDGSGSHDPLKRADGGLLFAWSCKIADGSACKFGTDVVTNSSMLSVPKYTFRRWEEGDYIFTLCVDCDSGMAARMSVTVTGIQVLYPIPHVLVSSKSKVANAGQRLVVYAEADSHSEITTDKLQVESSSKRTANKLQLIWTQEGPDYVGGSPEIVGNAGIYLGAGNISLVVSPEALQEGRVEGVPATFTFRLTAKDLNTPEGVVGGQSFGQLSIPYMNGPSGGTCTVFPREGVAFVTDFTFSCDGFTAADDISYSYHYKSATSSTVKAIAPRSHRRIRITTLPEGLLTIIFSVTGSGGATTRITSSVISRRSEQAKVDPLGFVADKLATSEEGAEGTQGMYLILLDSYATVVNSDEAVAMVKDSNGDLDQAATEIKKRRRMEARSSMLDSLQTVSTNRKTAQGGSTDPEFTRSFATVLKEVTNGELDASATEVAKILLSETLSDLSTQAADMGNEETGSKEDIDETVDAVGGTISNLLASQGCDFFSDGTNYAMKLSRTQQITAVSGEQARSTDQTAYSGTSQTSRGESVNGGVVVPAGAANTVGGGSDYQVHVLEFSEELARFVTYQLQMPIISKSVTLASHTKSVIFEQHKCYSIAARLKISPSPQTWTSPKYMNRCLGEDTARTDVKSGVKNVFIVKVLKL
jgi:hypothetical protein